MDTSLRQATFLIHITVDKDCLSALRLTMDAVMRWLPAAEFGRICQDHPRHGGAQ